MPHPALTLLLPMDGEKLFHYDTFVTKSAFNL